MIFARFFFVSIIRTFCARVFPRFRRRSASRSCCAAARRRAPLLPLVIVLAFAGGASALMIIVSLVDVTSFGATHAGYLAPATPLAIAFSMLAPAWAWMSLRPSQKSQLPDASFRLK